MFKLTSLLLEQTSKSRILFVGNYQLGNAGSFAKQLLRNGEVSGDIVSKYKATTEYIQKRAGTLLNNKTYESVILLVHPSDFGVSDAKRNTQDITPGYNYIIDLANSKNIPVTVILISSLYTTSDEINEMDGWASNIDGSILNFTRRFKSPKNFTDTYNLSKSSNDVIKSSLANTLKSLNITSTDSKAEPIDTADSDSATADVDDNAIDIDSPPGDRLKASRRKRPGNVREFINNFKDIAQDHQTKYGIPASITLAQGALESGWGNSYLSSTGNNYFGIKCHSWSGGKIYADDDAKGECFRKYDTPEESFEDHAVFLKQNGRYKSLFKTKDYLEWAYGLQAAGYATSKSYATSLINLIETYNLNEWDDQQSDDASEPKERIKLTSLLGRKLNVYSPFGMRKSGMHSGIDYSPMPTGSKIYILMPGTVRVAGNVDPNGWGNTIMVDHEDGSTTLYAHLSSVDVSKGDQVEANMFIGKTGGKIGTPGRGNSEGEHLHWEYHPGGYVGKQSAADGESAANKYFKIV